MGADLDLGDGTYEDFFFVLVQYTYWTFITLPIAFTQKSKEKHFCQHQYVNGYDKNALRFKQCGGIMDDLDSER